MIIPTKNTIREWMTENNLYDGIIPCLRNGEDFAIVEGWSAINRLLFHLVSSLTPQVMPMYREAGLVQLDQLLTYGSLAYGGFSVPKELEVALSTAGFDGLWFEDIYGEYGFSDQYEKCSECEEVIEFNSSSPDIYYQIENGKVCTSCFKDKNYKDDYLNQCINNPNKAVQSALLSKDELIAAGFRKYNEHSYQLGLHQGMNDKPYEILADLQSKNFTEVVFSLDSQNLFYAEFSAWVREVHWEPLLQPTGSHWYDLWNDDDGNIAYINADITPDIVEKHLADFRSQAIEKAKESSLSESDGDDYVDPDNCHKQAQEIFDENDFLKYLRNMGVQYFLIERPHDTIKIWE
ncbi:hypothetical protein BrL25_05500 [Brevibacillus laterosporus DSM 25]|nr:hypothetical protein BrL25_05500 [Brevibacillus laterosporus DSM 25]